MKSKQNPPHTHSFIYNPIFNQILKIIFFVPKEKRSATIRLIYVDKKWGAPQNWYLSRHENYLLFKWREYTFDCVYQLRMIVSFSLCRWSFEFEFHNFAIWKFKWVNFSTCRFQCGFSDALATACFRVIIGNWLHFQF